MQGTTGRPRKFETALCLAPGIALLAAVVVLHPAGQQVRGGTTALWIAQSFGALYLASAALLLSRQRPLAKLALTGWSTLVASSLAYAVYTNSDAERLSSPETASPGAARDPASKNAKPTQRTPKPDWRTEADGHDDAGWAEAYYRELRAANRAHWQPYVYWRRAPYRGRFITVEDDGRRSTFEPETLQSDAPRIWVFGGSTVWGTGAADDETIPSQLARQLHEAGQPARVVNFGETGYVNTQGLLRLWLELRRGNVPDVAVFYDGANDIASATQRGEAGVPMNESRRIADFLLGEGAPAPKPPEAPLPELANSAVDVYRANLRLLTVMASEYGFELCCFWQPVSFVHKPLTEFEQRASARVLDKPAFRQLADVVRLSYGAVASSEMPECFADLSTVFEHTTAPRYVDWCHMVAAGNADIAAAMLPHIVDALQAR